MPLVGKGPEGFGQKPQAGHVDRELTPSRGDHFAFGADPVTQIEVGQHGGRTIVEVRLLHEQLDLPGDILQVGEGECAVATDTGQAAGHPHGLTGSDVGSKVAVLRAAARPSWPCGRSESG